MKRVIATAIVTILLSGCGGGEEKAKPTTNGSNGEGTKKKKASTKPKEVKKKKVAKKADDAVVKRLRPVFQKLDTKDSGVRNEGMESLDSETGLAAKLPAILKSPDASVRRGAMYYLIARVDPDDREVFDAIATRLSDDDPVVRSRAMQLMREFRDTWIQPHLTSVAKLLFPANETEPRNRSKAARLLGSKRGVAKETLKDLAKAAKGDPDWRVRSACLAAVHQVGASKDTLPIFVASLKGDKDKRVRRAAASRLRALGRAARPVAADIVEALGDPEETVRGAAIEALVAVGQIAVKPLIKQLDTKDLTRKKWTILALGMLSRRAWEAKEPLRKLLKDKDPEVRKLVTAALKEIQ